MNGDEVLMRERKLGVAESGRLIPQLNVVSFASTLDAYTIPSCNVAARNNKLCHICDLRPRKDERMACPPQAYTH